MLSVTELKGKRILVVEDEALVAAMVADMLEDLGVEVVGPAGNLDAALDFARTAAIDAAVLDVDLRGERIVPVAEVLEDRGIKFVFATGYGAGPAGDWAEAPTLDKPYAIEQLADLLDSVIAVRDN